ncbi:MAG: TetR family transcriptional regulator [Thalassobium sp.]|uniref:TetR/AcrR family transcriptional regulator n=1 Tax=Thalassolituus pacificus TaxID=2975440 RepID=A0A9X2WCU3_9GAMM|nr:TetR/AcrR family transcriptional regulator [Thalassolituus pacificus]MCT7358041.1 TetR/AcrR family transcriptional regulator [Thalassolituus pacificus]PHS63539.1 MAG: TetR family transcriptional regulator [Thalassobium sp.]
MPVAVDGRRRLQPEERKRLLLTNAVEVFARRGIGRGGHTEIAEIGGVSVATVFNYFKTREALVEAVLEEVESFLLNLAEAVYAEEDNPLEAIRLHVKAFLNACEENPDYIKVWLEWSASVREEIWPQYLEFQNKLLDLIAKQIDKGIKKGILEQGLAPKERARWALGNAQMLVSMVFDPNGKPRGMEKMVERGFDHMLGVKA